MGRSRMIVLVLDTRIGESEYGKAAEARQMVQAMIGSAKQCLYRFCNMECTESPWTTAPGSQRGVHWPGTLALVTCKAGKKASQVVLKPPHSLHKAYSVIDWLDSAKKPTKAADLASSTCDALKEALRLHDEASDHKNGVDHVIFLSTLVHRKDFISPSVVHALQELRDKAIRVKLVSCTKIEEFNDAFARILSIREDLWKLENTEMYAIRNLPSSLLRLFADMHLLTESFQAASVNLHLSENQENLNSSNSILLQCQPFLSPFTWPSPAPKYWQTSITKSSEASTHWLIGNDVVTYNERFSAERPYLSQDPLEPHIVSLIAEKKVRINELNSGFLYGNPLIVQPVADLQGRQLEDVGFNIERWRLLMKALIHERSCLVVRSQQILQGNGCMSALSQTMTRPCQFYFLLMPDIDPECGVPDIAMLRQLASAEQMMLARPSIFSADNDKSSAEGEFSLPDAERRRLLQDIDNIPRGIYSPNEYLSEFNLFLHWFVGRTEPAAAKTVPVELLKAPPSGKRSRSVTSEASTLASVARKASSTNSRHIKKARPLRKGAGAAAKSSSHRSSKQ